MHPLISIIVPVYNTEKYLCKCLDSIISQSFKNWECILVDDGSTDSSPSICDEYVNKDIRFEVIHKENAGVSAARNDGLDKTQGEWIYFCDSDDKLHDENSLGQLYELTKNAQLAVGIYEVLYDNDKVAIENVERIRPFWGNIDSKSYIIEHMDPKLRIGYMGYLCNKFFRKDIISRHNLRFAPDIYYAEDFLFVLQYVSSPECKIIMINNQLKVYDYYQHTGSAMNNLRKQYNQKFFTDFIAYERMIDIIHNRYNNENIDFIAQCRLCIQGLWHLDMMEQSHFEDNKKKEYIRQHIQCYKSAYEQNITKRSLSKMKEYALTLPLNARVSVINEYLHSKDCYYKYLNKKWKIAWIIAHIAGWRGLWLIRNRMNFNSVD